MEAISWIQQTSKKVYIDFFADPLCVALRLSSPLSGRAYRVNRGRGIQPFEDPKKNIEKLMELVEAEDWPQNVTIEPNPMETLMQLATEENPKRIYEMFSLTAKRSAEGLQEKATELSCFLSEQVISWESYTWAQNVEDFNQSTATTREMFFYLHTDSGLYRCDIREVLVSTNQADVGISGVSFFPALYPGERPSFEDEVYRRYCTWGRDNAGISIVY